VSNPPVPPATTPCPKCRRPLAATAKRCTYCGTYRILAKPGTPEYEVERVAAEADAKRVERQKVIYQHGMGLGKSAAKPSLAARLREQSLPVKVAVMLVVVPLMMFVNPFKAFALAKEVFRP
jgi:DNA-directed RNA polymerase subunit RPC12/RpoP